MASKDNTDILSDHIMNAIGEIRNSKKRPDNNLITQFIQKNHSTNADFNFIEKAIEKLIKNKKIVNKPTIQDMTSYFPISNDQLNENKVTENEPNLQASALHRLQTYLSTKLHQSASHYLDATIMSKMKFSLRFMKIMSNLGTM